VSTKLILNRQKNKICDLRFVVLKLSFVKINYTAHIVNIIIKKVIICINM